MEYWVTIGDLYLDEVDCGRCRIYEVKISIEEHECELTGELHEINEIVSNTDVWWEFCRRFDFQLYCSQSEEYFVIDKRALREINKIFKSFEKKETSANERDDGLSDFEIASWLHYWANWAINNCENPAILNR